MIKPAAAEIGVHTYSDLYDKCIEFDIVAKPWYYNFHVCHVMLCGPKRLFPIYFHEERDIYDSVDNFFLSVQTPAK